MNRLVFAAAFFLLGLIMFDSNGLHGQQSYREPPTAVVDIIDAKPEPGVSISPDRKWMMLLERDAMPSIEDVSRRMLRLAGMRIDPAANSGFQTTFFNGFSIRALDKKDAVKVPLPAGCKLSRVSWSHDSNSVAFVTVNDKGSQLWFASVENPGAPKKLADNLSTVMGGFEWLPDAKHIRCYLVPENRGDEPAAPTTPTGPNVQESAGNTSPSRTYQDLLQNAHDEAVFEYYAKNQMAIVGLDGSVKKISAPQIFAEATPAPNGKYLLVTTVKKPFSYLLTVRSFPRTIEVWDMDGKVAHRIADVPMEENIPIEGVRTGPRRVDWMSGQDATLVWNEALDGGDPNKEVSHRDVYMTIAAPFDGKPKEMFKSEHRAFGLSYMADPAKVMTMEYDRDKRWVRSLMYDLSKPNETPKTMMSRSIRDRYGDPGRIVSVADATGHAIALQDGPNIYRMGAGASPKGNLPFIDRQNLDTLKTERLWRCEEGAYESVVAIVKSDENSKPVIITDSETPTTPPNYFLRDLNKDSKVAITEFKDPTPQIRDIKKQLVTYKRADGVDLSAKLYLPADYKEGTKLPLIVWAYPQEFNDAKTAAQVSGSQHNFTTMRGITHLTMLTQGYAIMDAATMPVIGDPETMNDTFIEQIVSSAQAAIDKAVEMGVADRNRVGVGGHSYGAFMTANLLAHCDLFKAGVARSGAYNRTLTPFGFQAERRSYWKAKDVYATVSPFMHADKIDTPILLIHGEEDNNSGTFPVQSKRMYQAIKGNGGTVRLVMLPKESHGYRARESVLHTQAEMIEWFDKHVKNASVSAESDAAKPQGATEGAQ